jgi:hypothetical protein
MLEHEVPPEFEPEQATAPTTTLAKKTENA